MPSENNGRIQKVEGVAKDLHLNNIENKRGEIDNKNGKNGTFRKEKEVVQIDQHIANRESNGQALLKKEIVDTIIEKERKETKDTRKEILDVLYGKITEYEKKIEQTGWTDYLKNKKLKNTLNLLTSVHRSIYFNKCIDQDSLDNLLKIEDLGDTYIHIKDDPSIRKLKEGESVDNIAYTNENAADQNHEIQQHAEQNRIARLAERNAAAQISNEEKTEIKKRLDGVGINNKLKTIGLDEDYFKNNIEWQNFSNTEKLLVIEQASQGTLSKVHEVAERRFEQKNKMALSWNPTKWNPLSLGKKMWNKMNKAYLISQEEKVATKEVDEGKIKPDEKFLNTLIEIQSELKLPMIEKDGKAFIEFESMNNNLSEEEKDAINKYNTIANDYSKIPTTWVNERSAQSTDKVLSGEKNHKKYGDIKKEYEEKRDILIESKVRQYTSNGISETEAKSKTMQEIGEIDRKIGLLQGLTLNPDAIEELNKIRGESSFGKLLTNNENVWRTGYMAAGYGTKATIIGTVGWLTAPIVGGILGGIRGRRKANENVNKAFNEGLREETLLERKRMGKEGLYDDKNKDQGMFSYLFQGRKVNTKEVAGFIDADNQKQRIDSLVNKINIVKDSNEKASLVEQLKARLDYIELKQEQGLVNFGKENPTSRTYELFKAMSEAYVTTTSMDDLGVPLTKEMENDLKERNTLLISIMTKNEILFGKKIASHKKAELFRSMMMGATLASLGAVIRELFYGGTAEEITEAVANNPTMGPVVEVVKEVAEEIAKHVRVEAVAEYGQGAISTLRELQHSLEMEYPDLSKVPENIKHILNTDAQKLAQEYGMYKPENKLESALDLKSIAVDEKGDVTYQIIGGNKDIKVTGTYEGKMFDSDHL